MTTTTHLKRPVVTVAKLVTLAAAVTLTFTVTAPQASAAPLSHAPRGTPVSRGHRPHGARRTGSVSPALRRAFGLFRLPPPADGASADATTTTAPASAAPPLPPIIESGLLAPAPMMEPYQLDVGATQGVTVDGHPVWVTPGVGGGCLDWTSQGLYGATNYSGVCGSTAQLDAGQLRGTSGNTPIQLAHTEPGYTFELVGLAPDASGDTVTALEPDGSELSLPVVDNVYVWVGPGPMLPDSITLVAANGATTNDTIGPAQ